MTSVLSRPCYASNFARSAAESASPELWPMFAVCPVFGNTGSAMQVVAGVGWNSSIGAATWTVGRDGPSLAATLTSITKDTWKSNTNRRLPGSCTVLIWLRPVQNPNNIQNCATLYSDGDGTPKDAAIGRTSTYGKYNFWFGQGYYNSFVVEGATNFTVDRPYVAVGRRSGITGAWLTEIFVDGTKDGSTTSDQNPCASGANLRWTFGKAANAYSGISNLYAMLAWNWALSDEQVTRVSHRPLAPFYLRRRIFAAAAAGGGNRRRRVLCSGA
jgi:hypothetical protein